MSNQTQTLQNIHFRLNDLYEKVCDLKLGATTLCTINTASFFDGDNFNTGFNAQITLLESSDDPDIESLKTSVQATINAQWLQTITELTSLYDTYKKKIGDTFETPSQFYGNVAPFRTPLSVTGAIRRIFQNSVFTLADVSQHYQKMLTDRYLALANEVTYSSKYVFVTVGEILDEFNLNKKFQPKISETVPNKAFYEKELKSQWDEFIKQLEYYFLGNKEFNIQLPNEFFKVKIPTNLTYLDTGYRSMFAASHHNLDTLLAEHQTMLDLRLKAWVDELVLGVDVEVPKSLLADRDNAPGNDTTKIKSQSEFLFWLTQQIDSLIGQFPIEIEIEDTDPTKPGNQSQVVKLPNLAEAIAEIYGLNVKTAINSEINMNFLARLATEAIAMKNLSIVTQDYVKSTASFLGFKSKQVKRKLENSFNFVDINSHKQLEDMLANSESYVVGIEETDNETIVSFLQKLLFSASIIKQVFFRGAKQKAKLLAEIGNFTKEDKKQDKDWKEFKKQIDDPKSIYNVDSVYKPDLDEFGTSIGGNNGT